MKLTTIFMNANAVEFSLQTNYTFDPQYRRVTIELTDEQSIKLKERKEEILSCVFFEEMEE